MDDVVKDASSLVIDMRGNGGGSVKTLEQITRRLFDRDVKIADLKGRRSMKPLVAKKRTSAFGGKVVVLVDAESGSAAEVLARAVAILGGTLDPLTAGRMFPVEWKAEKAGTRTGG